MASCKGVSAGAVLGPAVTPPQSRERMVDCEVTSGACGSSITARRGAASAAGSDFVAQSDS